MINSQLLITFTSIKRIDNTINKIIYCYDIVFDKIFLLQNKNSQNEIICSYNINLDNKIDASLIPPSTISVHRKKQTNTLYTINALNYLITALNDGILDVKFQIPWENYSNSVLVTTKSEFKKIDTQLYNIIEIQ